MTFPPKRILITIANLGYTIKSNWKVVQGDEGVVGRFWMAAHATRDSGQAFLVTAHNTSGKWAVEAFAEYERAEIAELKIGKNNP